MDRNEVNDAGNWHVSLSSGDWMPHQARGKRVDVLIEFVVYRCRVPCIHNEAGT